MSSVHGDRAQDANFVQMRPCQALQNRALRFGACALDGQNALVSQSQNRRTANSRDLLRGAFHRKRIENAARVLNPGRGAPQQPEPALGIEPAEVAGSVPANAGTFEFGSGISGSVKVSGEHMLTRDDDLPDLACRKAEFTKTGVVQRGEGSALLFADDAQRQIGDGHALLRPLPAGASVVLISSGAARLPRSTAPCSGRARPLPDTIPTAGRRRHPGPIPRSKSSSAAICRPGKGMIWTAS